MHTKSRRLAVGAALLTAATILPLVAATDAGAADTTVTFTVVAAGGLDLTAPVTAGLGSGTPSTGPSGQLGPVTVTDQRATLDASWTSTVVSTDFTTGGATPPETVGSVNVTYWSGPATSTVGTGTFTPGQATAGDAQIVNVPQTAFNHTGGAGEGSATWNPTVTVAMPAGVVVGVYTGTVTSSVL